MSEYFKQISDEETRAFAQSIYPIRKVGPLKFRVSPQNPSDDIRYAKTEGLAKLKAWKAVRVKIPTIGYKGKFYVTPEIVLSQLPKIDLSLTKGYSVQVEEPVNLYDDRLANVDPTYYEATVTLYQDKTKRKASTAKEDGSVKERRGKKAEENLFGF